MLDAHFGHSFPESRFRQIVTQSEIMPEHKPADRFYGFIVHFQTFQDFPCNRFPLKGMVLKMIHAVRTCGLAFRLGNIMKQRGIPHGLRRRHMLHHDDGMMSHIRVMIRRILRRLHHPVKFRKDLRRDPQSV